MPSETSSLNDGADGEAYLMRGDPAYFRTIHRRMPRLNYPTVVVRRSVYEAHGLFDLRYRYAMDYDLLLRFHRQGVQGVYVPGVVGLMGLGGAPDRSYVQALVESRRIASRHGAPGAAWRTFLYDITKLGCGGGSRMFCRENM